MYEDTGDNTYTQKIKSKVNNIYAIRITMIYPPIILYEDSKEEAHTHNKINISTISDSEPEDLEDITVGLTKLNVVTEPKVELSELEDVIASPAKLKVSVISGGYRPLPIYRQLTNRGPCQ